MNDSTHSSRTGRLRRLFSPDYLKESIRAVCRRFPLTVALTVVYTIYGLCEVWDVKMPEYFGLATNVSLSLGILLSLASYLWNEQLGGPRRVVRICELTTLALSCINFAYIFFRGQYLGVADGIGYSTAYTALGVAILFLPPQLKANAREEWHHSVGVLGALCLGLVLAMLLSAFTLLVSGTVDILFGLRNYRVTSTFITLMGCVSALAGLGHIPAGERTTEPGKSGLSVFVKNVLLPLAAVYSVILYAYGLKILFVWELPNGYICGMVTGLVAVSLVIIYGLQTYITPGEAASRSEKIARLAARWLPAALLPLLVLMSVAIFYRIGEYGITPKRLYVATFNLWSYGTVIYLLVSRQPRFSPIAASFAGIFFVTSVIPGFNYSTWGTESVREKVKDALYSAGVKELPISEAELENVLMRIPREKAESLAEDVAWLDDWDNHSAVKDIVSSESTLSSWELRGVINDKHNSNFHINLETEGGALSPIPTGFKSILYCRDATYTETEADAGGMVEMRLNKDVRVKIPADSLSRLSEHQRFRAVRVAVKDDAGSCYMITSFAASGYDEQPRRFTHISVEGYLLTNK